MAVIVKYIVVRNGEEKMTFVTKKEADAYDKMLDIADNLFDFLGSADINIEESQKEEISLLMAQRREDIMPILRGISPKKKSGSTNATPSQSPAKAPTPKAGPAKSGTKPPAKSPGKNPVKPKAAAAPKNG